MKQSPTHPDQHQTAPGPGRGCIPLVVALVLIAGVGTPSARGSVQSGDSKAPLPADIRSRIKASATGPDFLYQTSTQSPGSVVSPAAGPAREVNKPASGQRPRTPDSTALGSHGDTSRSVVVPRDSTSGRTAGSRNVSSSARTRPVIGRAKGRRARPSLVRASDSYPWGIGLFIFQDPDAARVGGAEQTRVDDAASRPMVVIIDATHNRRSRPRVLSDGWAEEADEEVSSMEMASMVLDEDREDRAALEAVGAVPVRSSRPIVVPVAHHPASGERPSARSLQVAPRAPTPRDRVALRHPSASRPDVSPPVRPSIREPAVGAASRQAPTQLATMRGPSHEAPDSRITVSGRNPRLGFQMSGPPVQGQMAPVSIFAAIKVRRQLEGVLQRVLTPQLGGMIRVKTNQILEGVTENGQKMLYLPEVVAQFEKCTIRDVSVAGGSLVIRDLALCPEQLAQRNLKVFSEPIIIPTLTVDRSVIVGLLEQENVEDVSVEFKGDTIELAGKFPYGIFTVPFRMTGRLQMKGSNLSFQISELNIKGKPAEPQHRAKLQSKMTDILPLEKALEAMKAGSMDLQGGRISVVAQDQTLYQAAFGDIGGTD